MVFVAPAFVVIANRRKRESSSFRKINETTDKINMHLEQLYETGE